MASSYTARGRSGDPRRFVTRIKWLDEGDTQWAEAKADVSVSRRDGSFLVNLECAESQMFSPQSKLDH